MQGLDIKILLFTEFLRCGSDSEQCIRSEDRCNGVRDCANSWDEIPTTCALAEDSHLRFVSPCKPFLHSYSYITPIAIHSLVYETFFPLIIVDFSQQFHFEH